MINFNQLRSFYHAAKHQHFTLAAEKLFITQPAVTAQIKQFEEYCNFKLFKKKGRGIFLTNEGRTLYNYAEKIFHYEKDLDNVIEEMRELKRGSLYIGTTKAYARYFMPLMMTSFHKIYPYVKIHLDEGSSFDMGRSLLEFRNEVAVIAMTEDHPDIFYTPFSHEELCFIMAPDHKLAGRKSASLKSIADEPIIMKEVGSGTRRLINELFEKNGLSPNILMETSNTEFIKQLVQRGDGVSFIVREAVTLELNEKKLATVPIEGENIILDVSIAYLKDQPLSPPAKAFLDLLLKMASKDKIEGIRTIMADMFVQWN